MKRLLADAMVDEQRFYQRYSEATRDAQRWRQRAELALGKGIEDLARAALERAVDHDNRASRLHRQYLAQKERVEGMKARLREMESLARTRPSAARVAELARVERPVTLQERREQRTGEERAALVAWAELERDELAEKLRALEREDLLERQLAELKARLGRQETRVGGQGPGAVEWLTSDH
jgi:phage shock protein A